MNNSHPHATGMLEKINEIHPSLPTTLRLRDDGTVWNCIDGQPPVQLPISYNQNRTAYVCFPANGNSGKPFNLWLGAVTYKVFHGPVPPNHDLVYLDGDRANVRADNLAVRPKSGPFNPAFPRWVMPLQEPGTAQNTPPPVRHWREEGPPSHRAA